MDQVRTNFPQAQSITILHEGGYYYPVTAVPNDVSLSEMDPLFEASRGSDFLFSTDVPPSWVPKASSLLKAGFDAIPGSHD